MTTPDMTARIAALDDSTDWSDPNVYANVLGTAIDAGDEVIEAPQGDTAKPVADVQPPPAAAPTPPAAPESSEAPAAAPAALAQEPDPEGVSTKDGKRVIPYAVLQSARHAATEASARAAALGSENQRLQEQLEALKRGEKPGGAAAVFSDEELEDLEADHPAMAKLARSYVQLRQQVDEARAAPAPVQASAPADSVQDLIDDRPLLARWQAKGGAVWDMAVELDKRFQVDASWAGKSMAERFAAVEQQIAEELGIALPAPASAASPAAPAPAAAAPIAAPAPLPPPKPVGMPSLSDLGGSAPKSAEDTWASISPRDALANAHRLSEADLMRMAGVSL